MYRISIYCIYYLVIERSGIYFLEFLFLFIMFYGNWSKIMYLEVVYFYIWVIIGDVFLFDGKFEKM